MPIPNPPIHHVPSTDPDGNTTVSNTSNCTQLKNDITHLRSQITFWNARLRTTPGPDGPGTARDKIIQMLGLLQDELATSQSLYHDQGCGQSIPTDECILGIEIGPVNGKVKIQGGLCWKWKTLARDTDAFSNPIQPLLGNPIGIMQYLEDIGLYVQMFEHGVISDIQGTNNWVVVYGDIFKCYQLMGLYRGSLGAPISDELDDFRRGRFSHFEHGDIYWRNNNNGAHEIHGPIRDKYNQLKNYGYPVTNQLDCSDGIGVFNHFENGSIYYTVVTGAYGVQGSIRDKWNSLGSEGSTIAYPASDESTGIDGIGKLQRFQNGMIYWTSSTGAHEIHGPILNLWSSLGYENSWLGYPVTDQVTASNNIGWQQYFQNGSIYWSGTRSAVVVQNQITCSIDVNTPDGIPLGGWVSMILNSDGTYRFTGSMRATGIPSYKYGLQVLVKGVDGVILAAFHSGNVYGSDTPGDRDDPWTEDLISTQIKDNWLSLQYNPSIEYTLQADISGVTGTLWDIIKIGFEGIVAFALTGPDGLVIFLGHELLTNLGVPEPPGLVAGIALAAGSIVIFGPGLVVPAFVTGLVIELASVKSRLLSDEEKDFARLIFGTCLDEYLDNRIWITNLSHDGGRKFTIPNVNGDILLNLNQAYDNPIYWSDLPISDYSQPGSVFAHELTHACQIATNSFVPGMICNGSGTYTYHQINNQLSDRDNEGLRLIDETWSQQNWTTFTREQQAHIVDDWYGAFCGNFNNLNELNNNLNTVDALNDPAFHFIEQLRAHIT